MKLHNMVRDQPWYRKEMFTLGAQAAGHQVVHGRPKVYDKDTALLIWNRYAEWHDIALKVEKAGGVVLVAENGYIGKGGTSPKFDVHPDGPQPHHCYALARTVHNGLLSGAHAPLPMASPVAAVGAGANPGPAVQPTPASSPRFDALGLIPAPWRIGGSHILVAANRSFGLPGRIMRPNWAEQVEKELARLTDVSIRVRGHPGNDEPKKNPLQADLDGAALVIIWSSTVGVHALVQGIPVVCCSPDWVCKDAALGLDGLKTFLRGEDNALPDVDLSVLRAASLERMAWAQWTVEEIESGLPFCFLLPDPR